jgi:hypothetical protein
MPGQTGLKCIRGSRLLAVVDADNLDFSLSHRGYRLRYSDLLRRLNAEAHQTFAVALLTSAVRDNRRADALRQAGWRPIVISWEWAVTVNGTRKLANADLDIAFETGVLSSVSGCNAVLLGTGDGDLAISIARGLHRTRKRNRVVVHTLSVDGATSTRLHQRRDLFDSSILIGRDLLWETNPTSGTWTSEKGDVYA